MGAGAPLHTAGGGPARGTGRVANYYRDYGGIPVTPHHEVRLRLVPDEPDQVVRLREFRAAHPDVIIGPGGFGTWQARIPEPKGETVATRYTLRELLDRLDELTGHQD